MLLFKIVSFLPCNSKIPLHKVGVQITGQYFCILRSLISGGRELKTPPQTAEQPQSLAEVRHSKWSTPTGDLGCSVVEAGVFNSCCLDSLWAVTNYVGMQSPSLAILHSIFSPTPL